MTRFWLLSLPAGLLLSSATPPPSPALELAAVDAEPIPQRLIEAEPVIAYGTPTLAAPPPPPPVAAAPEPEELESAHDLAPPAPEPAPSGVRVVVSIPLQRAYVFEDGELLATSPVSTGKRGHETPTGTFPILLKKVHHRSSKYDNAPMPYMQRLTNYGIALHAGRLPGYPASHGCIRLPRAFAKKLYDLTDYSTKVTITSRRPKSAEDALRLA
jgi:pyruvate/2-oxoglutarate dehydrogenase complex dihydrolipoamide acyltransferase (E2) component